jgi:hypothetical protein
VRRSAFVFALLLLAACEALPAFDQPVKGGAEEPRKDAPRTASLPPEAPSAPVPQSRPAERIDPKRLVGLTREQVTALIGPPRDVSDSPPATVWTYRAEGCSLEVMFYMDLGTRTFRALAYEVQRNDPARLAEPECLGRLRAARNVQ